ncbi:MAG TPA: hypothetical protein VFE98_04775 [Candidatus Bathyarchaeia archaeon]|nr:hypothetical protein [Candidatus Bathyarchaeia archaeon]
MGFPRITVMLALLTCGLLGLVSVAPGIAVLSLASSSPQIQIAGLGYLTGWGGVRLDEVNRISTYTHQVATASSPPRGFCPFCAIFPSISPLVSTILLLTIGIFSGLALYYIGFHAMRRIRVKKLFQSVPGKITRALEPERQRHVLERVDT